MDHIWTPQELSLLEEAVHYALTKDWILWIQSVGVITDKIKENGDLKYAKELRKRLSEPPNTHFLMTTDRQTLVPGACFHQITYGWRQYGSGLDTDLILGLAVPPKGRARILFFQIGFLLERSN